LPHDLVAQHAKGVDLQFRNITIREEFETFQPAAIADGARAKDLARIERLIVPKPFRPTLDCQFEIKASARTMLCSARRYRRTELVLRRFS